MIIPLFLNMPQPGGDLQNCSAGTALAALSFTLSHWSQFAMAVTLSPPNPPSPLPPTYNLSTRRLNFPSPASSDPRHRINYVQFRIYLLRNFPWVPEGCRTNTKCHSVASEAKSMPAQPPVNPFLHCSPSRLCPVIATYCTC